MNQKYFSWKWMMMLAVLFLTNCKVPYDPPVKPSKTHFLVVDGFLNAEGTTNIKLSRTRNITSGDTAAYINEMNASVIIEDSQNNVFPLYETGNGNYSANYSLDPYVEYRLHITTADQKQYLSDFVPCKLSPPIDNLGWKFKDGDVQVFVNTHDPNNNTTFYRWDYTETWEFHADYYSTLIYDPISERVVDRSVPVFVCYRTRNSSNIILGSSAKLQEDVIHEGPLTLIPNHDKRISVLYSAFVTQYALDSAGYNYWNAMKGNTEEVGSIFGSQPNQTHGNIHNIADSSELVVGYVGAGSVQQKRIFISNSEMPPGWNLPQYCSEYIVPKDSVDYYFSNNTYIPIRTEPQGNPRPTGYFSAIGSCVDCTLAGGTLQKPYFWP